MQFTWILNDFFFIIEKVKSGDFTDTDSPSSQTINIGMPDQTVPTSTRQDDDVRKLNFYSTGSSKRHIFNWE